MLTVSQTNAQSAKWMAGIQLAPGISAILGNSNLDKMYDPGFGFSGGLTMRYRFHFRFAGRPKVMYE